jgi:ribosomal protein S18 acetylase RimI-like enzyme
MLSTIAQTRRGRPDDAAALAALFHETWRHTYSGIIPHPFLTRMIHQRNEAWWRSCLAAADPPIILAVKEAVAGYATIGNSRAPLPIEGEIYELYLAPVYQGLGFGEWLFESARHALDERRLNGLIVWVLTENTRARRFYEARGGKAIAQASEVYGTALVAKTAYAWD